MVEVFMGYGTIKDGKLTSLQTGHFPQVYVGLDASKPTAAIGDYYIATDTGKTYICYVNGTWTLSDSKAAEEYSNHLGTTDNIMSFITSGNGTAITTAATHRADLSTGISAIGIAQYGGAPTINPTTDNFIFNAKIQNLILNTGGQAQGIIGLLESGATPTIGLQTGFSWATNIPQKWYALNYDGNATASLLLTNPSNGDLLTLIGNKTIIFFLINGVLSSTALTNIPNTACVPTVCLEAVDANITVARQISCDYISWRVFK